MILILFSIYLLFSRLVNWLTNLFCNVNETFQDTCAGGLSKAHFWTQNNHHLGRSSKHLRSIVRKSSAWKKSALCCCLKLCFMGILCEWETWRHFQRNQRNVRHCSAAHHIYVFISKTLMSCQIPSSIGKLYKNACAQFLGSDGTWIEKGQFFRFMMVRYQIPFPMSQEAKSE